MTDEVEVFKALSDPTRLRIMKLLLTSGKEICGCEFVDSLQVPQYNLSRHLDILKQAGVVTERKEGRWVYYSGCVDQSRFCKDICRGVQQAKGKIFTEDLKRLNKRFAMRKDGICYLGIQNPKLKG